MKSNYLIKYNIKYKTLTFIRTSVDHLYPLHNTCNNLLNCSNDSKTCFSDNTFSPQWLVEDALAITSNRKDIPSRSNKYSV